MAGTPCHHDRQGKIDASDGHLDEVARSDRSCHHVIESVEVRNTIHHLVRGDVMIAHDPTGQRCDPPPDCFGTKRRIHGLGLPCLRSARVVAAIADVAVDATQSVRSLIGVRASEIIELTHRLLRPQDVESAVWTRLHDVLLVVGLDHLHILLRIAQGEAAFRLEPCPDLGYDLFDSQRQGRTWHRRQPEKDTDSKSPRRSHRDFW